MAGRPPKLRDDEQTLKQLEGLGRIHCTTREAADFLEVTEKTFIVFLQRHIKARDAFNMGPGKGKVSLRRMQWRTAESGNAAMQIWLGKQILGQRDQAQHDVKHGFEASVLEFFSRIDGQSAGLPIKQ